MYSPSHRQIGAPMTNFQSARHTAPDFCKNVSLAVLFGSNGNIYTIYTQSDMCIYSHVRDIQTLVGQKKLKNWDSSEWRVQRKSFRVPFWARMPQVRQPCRMRIGISFPRSKSNHSLSCVEQDRLCTNNVILWRVRVTTLAFETQQCNVFLHTTT
jgi:hypothetical protein